MSRSYYCGAAGAILIYDISSHASFNALPTFLNDARALASPQLTLLLAGNKTDLAVDLSSDEPLLMDPSTAVPSSLDSQESSSPREGEGSPSSARGLGIASQNTRTVAPEGRQVSLEEASQWASSHNIPLAVEVSALSGDNVEELFTRLARMILTKIELGEIDPDDSRSGIQYGDSGSWAANVSDISSIKSGMTLGDDQRRRRKRRRGNTNGWTSGLQEWEEVFRLDRSRRRRGGCC